MAQDFVLQLTPVESSNIEAVGYVAASGQLFVQFKSGGLYEYAGVPSEVYDALMTTASKGSYVHKHIKPFYTATRIAQTAAPGGGRPAMSPEQSTEAYTDRNLLAQLCAQMAGRLGYDVWWQPSDAADPGWPVLLIDLPTGQISYHIPQAEVQIAASMAQRPWDGHTTEEKRARILRYLAEGG